MPLQTGFKRIGSAGKTVDGRQIEKQWLSQMAKSYDPEKYAAVINLNHWDPRWAGTYGKVLALKLGEKDGNPILLANIEPKEQLIALSKREVLYSSMEIHPDFQGEGKAYLTGLAVTPKPASTDTEELKFACGQPKDDAHLLSEFVEIELTFSEQNEDSEEAKFFTKFKQFITGSQVEQSTPSNNNTDENKTDKDDSDMNLSKETAEKLTVALSELSGKLDAFTTNNLNDEAAPKPLEEKLSALETEHAELKTKFAELSKQKPDADDPLDENTNFAEIQDQLTKLSAQLAKASGEQPGTEFGEQINDEVEDIFV